MKEKLINIKVTKALYNEMVSGKVDRVFTMPIEKPKHKDTPYIKVIITGKKPKKKYENFNKVKFPALCLYGWNTENVGMINCAFLDGKVMYELHDMTVQHETINRQSDFESLEKMDECYNIREIVRCKIIAKRG